ncbi:hypothetical protein FACS189472_08080 [Alphaproteobacteria bacterium]|nr:hypothetical protein FACS189472_08080 [Alphaproteobacteria bacterium]
MCPFLDEEDDFDHYEDYIMNPAQQLPEENSGVGWSLKQKDRKFIVLGGVASLAAFSVVVYLIYSNSKPVGVEELPVIRANTTPIKTKPKMNESVGHQDKVVYDNISGEKTAAVAVKTIPQPEEVLPINGMDMDAPLSDEEKKNIIQAFDELAPEKEYKINYVKSGAKKGSTSTATNGSQSNSNHRTSANEKNVANISKKDSRNSKSIPARSSKEHRIESKGLVVFEDENPLPTRVHKDKNTKKHNNIIEISSPTKRKSAKKARDSYSEEDEYSSPIKRLDNESLRKNKKSRLRELVNKSSRYDDSPSSTSSTKGNRGVMVQIASLATKSAAEVEYKRLLPRNKALRGVNKNIVKVDLGRKKGIRYRVIVGPFRNDTEANKFIRSMKNGGVNAYISR